MVTLFHIPHSPWSERARWALDHTPVPHRRVLYTSMVTEPRLRWRLGRATGRITLPVLLTDDGPLEDSVDIARWAAQRGGPALGADLDDVRALAEEALDVGRVRTTQRVVANAEQLRASLPGFLQPLGPIGLAVGRKAGADLLRKYPVGDDDLVARMRAALEGLQTWTQAHPPDTLTVTHILAATALAFVRPVAEWANVPEAAAPGWEEPELTAAFADLVAWRDALYSAHRRGPAAV